MKPINNQTWIRVTHQLIDQVDKPAWNQIDFPVKDQIWVHITRQVWIHIDVQVKNRTLIRFQDKSG